MTQSTFPDQQRGGRQGGGGGGMGGDGGGGGQGPGGPQPHSLDAERSVLGALLLSDRAMYTLIIEEGLKPEDFFSQRHRHVFRAMRALYDQGEPFDRLTVKDWLDQHGTLAEAGGDATLDELSGPIVAAGNVRQYARIVRDHALMRGLLRATADIQQSVAERRAKPRELVEYAERSILQVAHDDRQKDFRSLNDVLQDETEKLHKLSLEGDEMTGIPTGFTDLDKVTGGFQRGNLVIVAARPAMGKSAFVTNVAEHAALNGYGVALFSMEMGEGELAQRFLASQAKVRGDDLRRGRIDARRWPKILEASNRLAQAPLYIDDTSDISILEVRAKARRLHQRHKLDMIIVDYLQLMRADANADNRVQAVGEMSRGLKILARELDLPVIALSQLSRQLENRGASIESKKPQLSDLRESGQIEQDADIVMFLFREEYYDPETENKGMAEVIIAKHRNGGLDTIKLTFLGEYLKFANYQPPDRYV